MGDQVDLMKWVENICGVGEKELRKDPGKYIRPTKRKEVAFAGRRCPDLEIAGAGKVTQAGALAVVPVGTLLREVAARAAAGAACTFHVQYHTNERGCKYCDVGHLQATAASGEATFQVASNFNGIEGVREDIPPTSETFLSFYVHDKTQGPTACVSAGAAAIVRVLAPFYHKRFGITAWGSSQQSKKRQIEMLGGKEVGKYFNVTNGYVVNKGVQAVLDDAFGQKLGTPRGEISEEGRADIDRLMNDVRVCLHMDAQVVTGHREGMKAERAPPDQFIDQVVVAAVNMKQGTNGLDNATHDHNRAKMRLVLRAVYRGTYAAAIARGKKALYLTLIGGGAFGNDIDEIYRAIAEAHAEFTTLPQNTIEHVYLPLFSGGKAGAEKLKQALDAGGVKNAIVRDITTGVEVEPKEEPPKEEPPKEEPPKEEPPKEDAKKHKEKKHKKEKKEEEPPKPAEAPEAEKPKEHKEKKHKKE